jgi:hypothetical protein
VSQAIYDATTVVVLEDGSVALGLGDDGETPAAVIRLCPHEGGPQLVAELEAAIRRASPIHRHHYAPNRAMRRARRGPRR